MGIPKELKIGGINYDVEVVPWQDVPGALGEHNGAKQRIRISADQSLDMQESALLHEIIEALNYMYSLNLKHSQIEVLESTLYQVLKDNALGFA